VLQNSKNSVAKLQNVTRFSPANTKVFVFTDIFSNFAFTMILSILTTIPMLVCLFITIQLILEQKRLRTKNTPMQWLTVWTISSTLLYMGHVFYFWHKEAWLPVTDTIYVAMNLCVYPLFLIYISELTEENSISKKLTTLCLLLAPSVVAFITCGTLYTAMGAQETSEFIEGYLYHNSIQPHYGLGKTLAVTHTICRIIFAMQVIAVAFWGIRKINHFNHTISQLYADTDDKEPQGLNTLLILLVVTSIISALANIFGRDIFIDTIWIGLPSITFSIMLFSIGWIGLHQHFSISNVMEHYPEEDTITENYENSLSLKLDRLMQEKKTFLENDLRLEQVTRELGTNRTYLLQALNEEKGMTFKEYINRLRIEYAEQLMESNPHLTKSEIATMSGYNTLSSFYRNYNTYHK
jgi:AraC-like DNA-binding protein